MIWLLATAFAGSISLEVATTEASTTVDFGAVNAATGGTREGRRVQTEDATFLIVEVTATARWQAHDTLVIPRSTRRMAMNPSVMSPTAMSRMPSLPLAPVVSDASDDTPPAAIDLYVQTARERGDAAVWVGHAGTNWALSSGTPVSQLPTLVGANVPLDTPYNHELALEITPWTEGLQQKEIVYTAIIP